MNIEFPMSGSETFAPIHIDDPQPTGAAADATAHAPEPDESIWRSPIGAFKPTYPDMRMLLQPEEGQQYRMVPMAQLLNILDVHTEGDGYLDDTATAMLRSKLYRLGLALATTISGPLRLRCSDTVPVIDRDEPQPTKYSTVTVCLYLIAWMLQGDSATARDMAIADAWIESYDPKADWAGAAQGTLRWLLSRRLFLTAKRKQRLGRIKRFANVRGRLIDLLLQLVSDPQYASAKRMKRLETIYSALDLNPADIHSDIHRMATATPIVVTKGSTAAIDTNRLKEMSKSTEKAQEILAGIFAESQDEDIQPSTSKASKEEPPALGILRQLAEKAEWSSADASAIAKKHGMTLGAMLELVNDLSFDLADEAVADDAGDTIYIDQDVVELLSC